MMIDDDAHRLIEQSFCVHLQDDHLTCILNRHLARICIDRHKHYTMFEYQMRVILFVVQFKSIFAMAGLQEVLGTPPPPMTLLR